MLSAMPDTTWLPRWVMQAKPCTRLTSTEARTAAPSPAHAEPVTAAMAAAAKAEASILPSRPMSTTPARSEQRPPSAASTSGVAPRTVAAASTARRRYPSLIDAPRDRSRLEMREPPGGLGAGPAAEQRFERLAQRLLEGATHENDHALDDHDEIAGERRDVERQLRAALVEGAEEHGGQRDAGGVVPAHQRDSDADVAGPPDEVQQQAVLDPHDLVDAHQPGKGAGDAHRRDHGARGADAAVDGGRLAVAERAQLVAPARAPEIEPHEEAGGQGEERRDIHRRLPDLPAKRPRHAAELGQPAGGRELPRLRRLLARLDQDVHQEIRHERRGDEVEHDRRDHDVAAAACLEPPRHERPQKAEEGRGGDGDGDGEPP